MREVTGYTRQQVNRLVRELEAEDVQVIGHGRGARYEFAAGGKTKKLS